MKKPKSHQRVQHHMSNDREPRPHQAEAPISVEATVERQPMDLSQQTLLTSPSTIIDTDKQDTAIAQGSLDFRTTTALSTVGGEPGKSVIGFIGQPITGIRCPGNAKVVLVATETDGSGITVVGRRGVDAEVIKQTGGCKADCDVPEKSLESLNTEYGCGVAGLTVSAARRNCSCGVWDRIRLGWRSGGF